ncbi:hypothetical protein CXG81DRAFT_16258 [Caulochytrium protostelioides]|uniref:Uncharacterized protein n=1 Tax=Caulochytrium protostelioides TaxID=1555241 RepID=A0A4P9XFB9_9FUNG|nr:hypothetical protein CXG81DRAFT_16258 [Caulochytrium protostelioides]|eukprot:RKP04276.1 hypothetical protein CXG81DRAFT_16258 [Caulochytrium protostelioides]
MPSRARPHLEAAPGPPTTSSASRSNPVGASGSASSHAAVLPVHERRRMTHVDTLSAFRLASAALLDRRGRRGLQPPTGGLPGAVARRPPHPARYAQFQTRFSAARKLYELKATLQTPPAPRPAKSAAPVPTTDAAAADRPDPGETIVLRHSLGASSRGAVASTASAAAGRAGKRRAAPRDAVHTKHGRDAYLRDVLGAWISALSGVDVVNAPRASGGGDVPSPLPTTPAAAGARGARAVALPSPSSASRPGKHGAKRGSKRR